MASLPTHLFDMMNGGMEDDFKKNLESPSSQASTAASSPAIAPSAQPKRSRDGFTSFDSLLGSRMAEVTEEAEAENEECIETGDSMEAYTSTDQDSTDEYKEQDDLVSAGMPPLQSGLGQWALKEVQAEIMVSKGMPPLQSELGQWAKKEVQAEMWLEAQQRKKADWEGPALDFGGRALDLGSGRALFFSHNKELASGHAEKKRAKELFQLLRAAQLAHAACEAEVRIEAGEVCSIDEAGVLHGGMPASGRICIPALRLKKFQRRCQRQCGAMTHPTAAVLCADESGKVSLYLNIDDVSKKRQRCPKMARARFERSPVVLSIDVEGIVQDWTTITLDTDGNVS